VERRKEREESLPLMQAPTWAQKHMQVVGHTLNECEEH